VTEQCSIAVAHRNSLRVLLLLPAVQQLSVLHSRLLIAMLRCMPLSLAHDSLHCLFCKANNDNA
jgi:hypothetical protein